jgi:hypothetical protein
VYSKSSTKEKTMNVYDTLVQVIDELVWERVAAKGWDDFWVELVEPEGDEYLRFEVLVDDGDEDLLVVADGEIDYGFNLILNILED